MKQENIKPSYYGILTAEVRYDEKLPDKAKIMFSEVTALSNAKGYCNASNRYFADLYNRDPSTVSRWFKALRVRGHIAIELIYQGKEVNERRIFPKGCKRFLEITIETNGGVLHSVGGGVLRSVKGGSSSSVKENTTSLPSGKEENTKRGAKPLFIPPTREVLARHMHGRILLMQKVITGKFWAVYEADKFLEWFEDSEWKTSKGKKMKDWKRAASGWVRRAYEDGAFLKPCPSSPEFGEKKSLVDEREKTNLESFVSPLDRVSMDEL